MGRGRYIDRLNPSQPHTPHNVDNESSPKTFGEGALRRLHGERVLEETNDGYPEHFRLDRVEWAVSNLGTPPVEMGCYVFRTCKEGSQGGVDQRRSCQGFGYVVGRRYESGGRI
jgi:hypothetical protein